MHTSLKEMKMLQDRDPLDNLLDWRHWTESYAEELAPSLGIPGGLTPRHWEVIQSIRKHFADTGKCPVVYQTCRQQGLRLRELEELFPTGYQRGACKLAGLNYLSDFHPSGSQSLRSDGEAVLAPMARTYRVDERGFLLEPVDWDERWAAGKADELGAGGLTDQHWLVVRGLREAFARTGEVPTVYETCDRHGLELDDLERLFPSGYHRGAVKIAGLRS
jgi:tRNA 2-thiouridine synthesizing protein E